MRVLHVRTGANICVLVCLPAKRKHFLPLHECASVKEEREVGNR